VYHRLEIQNSCNTIYPRNIVHFMLIPCIKVIPRIITSSPRTKGLPDITVLYGMCIFVYLANSWTDLPISFQFVTPYLVLFPTVLYIPFSSLYT